MVKLLIHVSIKLHYSSAPFLGKKPQESKHIVASSGLKKLMIAKELEEKGKAKELEERSFLTTLNKAHKPS